MRIASVTAFPVRIPRDHQAAQGSAGSPHRLTDGAGEYRWSAHYPALYSTQFETCLVRVSLDNGLIGWGEAQAPLAPEVPAQIVQSLLSPAIVGEDFDIATLWQRMYSTMRVRGQTGGFMLDAIAGVDLALWDIATQIEQKPLREILGYSQPKSLVPAYVSGTPGRTLEDKLRFVQKYREAGFHIFKLYFESDWDDLLAQIDAMQERFDDIEIAVDALWHLPSIDCAADLAERRVLWLECPLPPEDLKGHVELVNETGVRLALGESYRTRYEAEPFFEKEILSYWQPDLGRSGISETLVLAKMAKQAGIAIVPHVSIAMPPQLHAAIETAAAIPNATLCEFNPSVVEMANRYVLQPGFQLVEGAYLRSASSLGGASWDRLAASLRINSGNGNAQV
ncbi:mandelate racemase/muconate lactonizing enzyme family protein [Bryobacter aggregatus]|uniref:mandelate racemase/muconate lactonizing enzyme family protein n=1 Tax=Bryobacter aggregatus TaxID=360054 RepID=UPI0004E0E94C|nr:mandelate racemase/muconate lactonizing enzyme family protein [Bryobacter aggregatus]